MFQRANIKFAYWIIFLFLIASLTSFNLYFIDHQRKLLVELEQNSLNNELEIAAEFIREDIAAERYQHIEPFFQLWAHRNHKIISITAIADNGFILTEHEVPSNAYHTIKLDKEIKGPVGISLEVKFDLTEVEEKIHDLSNLLIVTDIGFISILMILLWLIMQSYLIKPLRNSEEKYIHLASKDPLTKINNRRAFYELCEREISRCRRHSRPLCMLIIDLDYFKNVNDNFGHQVGDHILQLVTTEINLMVRETDVFGRLGGEEFAICLPELTLTSAILTAERLRMRIESLPVLELDNKQYPITISIGLSEILAEDSIELLLERCDKYLYQAKEQGRNCLVSDNSQNKKSA